jgi:hypothetical protein
LETSLSGGRPHSIVGFKKPHRQGNEVAEINAMRLPLEPFVTFIDQSHFGSPFSRFSAAG